MCEQASKRLDLNCFLACCCSFSLERKQANKQPTNQTIIYCACVVAVPQVLRREGAKPSVCMVLLSFRSIDKADAFYADYNGMPFSSLEPDIPCR